MEITHLCQVRNSDRSGRIFFLHKTRFATHRRMRAPRLASHARQVQPVRIAPRSQQPRDRSLDRRVPGYANARQPSIPSASSARAHPCPGSDFAAEAYGEDISVVSAESFPEKRKFLPKFATSMPNAQKVVLERKFSALLPSPPPRPRSHLMV